MASATKKQKSIELPIAQFIAIIVLSLTLFLIVDFGRRAATGYQIQQEENRLVLQYQTLQQKHAALLAKLDQVQSDAYIEHLARNELKWSRPGETVMVVLSPYYSPSATPANPSLFVEPALETPLEAWKNLFFPETK